MARSTPHRPTIPHLLSVLGDIAHGLLEALGQMGEAHAQVSHIKALAALSDQDLAARGMGREDIIRLVLARAI